MACASLEKYDFHKCNHRMLASNEAYRSLTLDQLGALFKLRNLAGETRQRCGVRDGSLRIEKQHPMKTAEVARWLAKTPGSSSRSCQEVVRVLSRRGLVSVGRTGIVKMAGWQREQESAATPDAGWKRAERARSELAEGQAVVTDLGARLVSKERLIARIMHVLRRRKSVAERIYQRLIDAHIIEERKDGVARLLPPSPCPPTADLETTAEPDMSGRIPLTCQEESKNKDIRISSTVDMSTGQGEGGSSLDKLFAASPVRCAMHVCRAGGKSDQNIFGARLRDLQAEHGLSRGMQIFRECVFALASELRAGEHAKIRNLPSLLTKRLGQWTNHRERLSA
jgi:hypothetical protein